jgi:phosphoribosylamine--glycine ligase
VVERVTDWARWMRWAELVFVTDNCQYMRQLQAFHDLGYPIFGCNMEGARLELDRYAGQTVLAKLGIDSIPSKLFRDYDSAMRYVKSRNTRLVCKPNGEADKALSYVAPKDYSVETMLDMLGRWKADPKFRASAAKDGFIVQDFIPGIEMGVSGYFGPAGFNACFTEHWEFKKLMPGDMGPNTGEMGTVIRYVTKSKLVDKMLRPLAPLLERIRYRGDIAVNCMIDEKGKPWPMELTCRAGWPAWIIETSLRAGDPATWMADLLHGRDTLQCSDQIAIGAVVAQPPFPYEGLPHKNTEGYRVYGFGDWTRHHPCDMQYKDGQWLSTGNYLCVVTGLGKTVSGARLSVRASYKSLTFGANPFYRDDIGERLQKQIPLMQKHGYAAGMEY